MTRLPGQLPRGNPEGEREPPISPISSIRFEQMSLASIPWSHSSQSVQSVESVVLPAVPRAFADSHAADSAGIGTRFPFTTNQMIALISPGPTKGIVAVNTVCT